MSKLESYDVIVVGAGMVGAAIAYGQAKVGLRVLVLDGSDTDYRAAKANFGLVWVQGKGYGAPAYQKLSREAAKLWPEFARTLECETGIAIDYDQCGGLHFCLGEDEWQARQALLASWLRQAEGEPPCARMLDRSALQALLPGVHFGPDVSGASLGSLDGHVNPLRLLAALHKGLLLHGATLLSNHPATDIRKLPGTGFSVTTADRIYEGAQVVIAAGLGSASLAGKVGLDVPLHPQRGQILVTERLSPLLPMAASGIRQTAEGTVMIGVTQENVGYNLGTTSAAAATMARKAIRILPELAKAGLVRQWSCLRIKTPDGCPVYAESLTHPGAMVAVCHSGVTLASFHAGPLFNSQRGYALAENLGFFHHGRFDVPKTQ